ncbi:MAG: IPT/TIG domain-containing protein [Terriglobales bacterium]
MRYFGFLLLGLITLGCGTDPGNHDPRTVATVFSPPSITELAPNTVPINSVPFTMTINGENFGTDAVVFWNGNPQFTTFITAQQIMVAVTASDLMFWGQIPVYVRTGGMNSNTVDFNVAPQ